LFAESVVLLFFWVRHYPTSKADSMNLPLQKTYW